MVTLHPMPRERFAAFAGQAIADHADDNVRALRWAADGALARAQARFAALLPQGLDTPGHSLCEIHALGSGEPVGQLWYEFVPAGPAGPEPTLYLFNILVHPQHRGRGLAKAAMDQLQRRAVALGAASIALHVFALNSTAQALYRSAGFGITGFNMVKRLEGSGVRG